MVLDQDLGEPNHTKACCSSLRDHVSIVSHGLADNSCSLTWERFGGQYALQGWRKEPNSGLPLTSARFVVGGLLSGGT